MAKRPDMQVVGSKIAHLRREKGMCVAAFAGELEQPDWVIMLFESAHMEQSMKLIELFPDSVIEELLQDIQEIFGVSRRWLTTRCQSPKHPVLPDVEPSPTLLYLPVAISPEDTLFVLDDLMALVRPNSDSMLQNERFFRQRIKSVMMLHQLQWAQLQKNGQEALAGQQRQRFKKLREERIACWMKELKSTENAEKSEPA